MLLYFINKLAFFFFPTCDHQIKLAVNVPFSVVHLYAKIQACSPSTF